MTAPERRPGQAVIVVIGIFAVVAAAIGAVVIFTGGGSDDGTSGRALDGGRTEFEIDARVVREASAEGPLYFPDPLGDEREIYVLHEGDSEVEGYRAFSARGTSGCKLQYTRDDPRLVDTCTGQQWRPDGRGLPEYQVRVQDGRLYIDLNTLVSDGIGQPTDGGLSEEDQ